MSRSATPKDAADQAIDRDLRRLFAPRRCDADEFAAGVARRIAAAPEESVRGDASPSDARSATAPAQPMWQRRAAAWLPVEAAALLGVGGKAIPAVLAIPALILASCALALVGGLRSLRRDGAHARSEPSSGSFGGKPAPQPGATTLILFQFGPLVVLLASLWFGGERALDLWLALIVTSMVALTLLARRAARAGLMDRPRVARLCVGLLMMQLLAFVQFPWQSSGVGVDWVFGPAGAAWTLLAGAWICSLASGGRLIRIGQSLLITGIAALWLAISPPLSSSPLARARATPEDLREIAQRLDLDPADLRGWRELQAIVEALKRAEATTPDLSATTRRLSDAIAGGARPHPVVLTAALHCGMLSHEDLCRLAEDRVTRTTLTQWTRAGASLPWIDSDEYLFPLWLAVDSPDVDARAAMLRRIESNWPAADAPLALNAADRCVRAWTWLGATDRIEAHRASLAEILTRHWIGEPTSTRHAELGGFSSEPSRLATSLADATNRGVRLLAWSGVPAGVDVGKLRLHLLRESQPARLWFRDTPVEWKALERASLVELDAIVAPAPAGVIARLVRERLLLGSLALMCLCLFAVATSPPGADEALRRARRRSE